MEVPGPVQWQEIPPALLAIHHKSDVPEELTWSELAQLWVADRESLDLMIANVKAISGLGNNLPESGEDDSVE